MEESLKHRTHRTYRIRGGITGDMWWPVGVPGARELDARLSRNEHEPFADYFPHGELWDTLESVLRRNDGDFQGGSFTGDTTITICHTYHRGARVVTHERSFALADMPSLADLVEADIYVTDFMAEDY